MEVIGKKLKKLVASEGKVIVLKQKEYDEEGEILKFSDIIKAFGSFSKFKKFFREIEKK